MEDLGIWGHIQEISSSQVHKDASDSSQFHEEISKDREISNIENICNFNKHLLKPRHQADYKDDDVAIGYLLQLENPSFKHNQSDHAKCPIFSLAIKIIVIFLLAHKLVPWCNWL